MDLSYDENKQIMDKYIQECRDKIMNTFFNEEELKEGIPIKKNLISKGYPKDISLQQAIKQHRNNMIDIKVNHTMRVVEDVTKMSQKMNIDINFTKALKVAALLHDIGRFEQATWNNNYKEDCYRNIEGINNHADAGYHILIVNKKINDFKIPFKLQKPISNVVKYHGTPKLEGSLAYRIHNVKELNIEDLLNKNTLNDSEKIITSTLVQMIKDVDMLDILYQHLTGEFNVIKEFITFKTMGEDIEKISYYWGLTKEEILEYNGLEEDEVLKRETILIPTKNIDPIKFEVPKDIQEMFFQKKDLDLQQLMARRDWTFITGMWFRLNHFLRNINFVSNLMVVEDNKLLEKIYETYPDKYKPLVKEAFEFSKNELLEKAIKENEGQIYKTK